MSFGKSIFLLLFAFVLVVFVCLSIQSQWVLSSYDLYGLFIVFNFWRKTEIVAASFLLSSYPKRNHSVKCFSLGASNLIYVKPVSFFFSCIHWSFSSWFCLSSFSHLLRFYIIKKKKRQIGRNLCRSPSSVLLLLSDLLFYRWQQEKKSRSIRNSNFDNGNNNDVYNGFNV